MWSINNNRNRSKKSLSKLFSSQTGDTIIEVLFAMTIIGLSLGISFAIANRANNTGLSARERSEALKFAESQLEYLKSNSNNLSSLRTATPNCIIDGVVTSVLAVGSVCTGTNRASLYNLSLWYVPASGGNPETFRSVVTWPQLSTSTNGQVELVYRP